MHECEKCEEPNCGDCTQYKKKGGTKNDQEKVRFDLIPPEAEEANSKSTYNGST